MDKTLQKVYGQVAQNIDGGHISRAIAMLRKVAQQYADPSMSPSLAKVEEAYGYMLKYVIEGADDPTRPHMLHDFAVELYRILDVLIFNKQLKIESNLYFGTIRTRLASGAPSIAERLSTRSAAYEHVDLLRMVGTGPKDAKDEYRSLEKAEVDLFNAIWTTPWLSKADTAALAAFLAADSTDSNAKVHVLSALMLAQLFTFDPAKLELQLRAYLADDASVSIAALIGVMLGLWHWRSHPLPASLVSILDTAKEKDSWHSDFSMACLELLRAFDTERVNRKIKDEFIPILRDINSDIQSLMKDTNIDPSDMASLEENPEWADMLEKSGAKDKLKEISDMQMEGADVMMSTFAHLKQFPFFREAANWFLPFRAAHTEAIILDDSMTSFVDVLEQMDLFCDSDKYSFVLSLRGVPEEQRKFMTGNLSGSHQALSELMSRNLTAAQKREQLGNRHMKNLYRFFKLFSRKDEFPDPFAEGINLLDVPAFAADLTDPDLLRTIADFDFSRGYLEDALRAYYKLCQVAEPDARVYQRMGYAHEKLGQRQSAISYYRKAEMLDSDSLWTLRRLAACFRSTGNFAEAVRYYTLLQNRLPEDTNIALRLGYALLENGDYNDAIQQFYKVTFMDESSIKPYRPLAWTLFLTGDFDGAEKQYMRIFNTPGAATPGDYVNFGHLYLARGKCSKAIEMYAQALAMPGFDKDALRQSYQADRPVLERLGVPQYLFSLIEDALALKISQI